MAKEKEELRRRAERADALALGAVEEKNLLKKQARFAHCPS